MSEVKQPVFECEAIRSSGNVGVTVELIRAQQHYRSARGFLMGYVLATQPEDKLVELRYERNVIKGIKNHGDGRLIYAHAKASYRAYVANLNKCSESERFTFMEVLADAAGRVHEDVSSRFHECDTQPWQLPKPVTPVFPDEIDVGSCPELSFYFE